jgi:serine/threonine protein kinase
VGNVGRFTEDEARHWMHQILNSLETLHNAGIAHRDLSLENVMIHNDRAVLIDLGMSLPIPFDSQTGQRRLIAPQGAAGKLKYMAPEVYSPHNQEGFDGFAICGLLVSLCISCLQEKSRGNCRIRQILNFRNLRMAGSNHTCFSKDIL